MSSTTSGFARARAALGDPGVDFVVVGVGGINFYARTPADAISTLDVDVFLRPASENLRTALSVLSGLGYAFEAGGEPFVDLADELVLRRIIENGARDEAIERSVGQEILGASESTNWVLSSRLRTLPVALRGSTSTIAMS